jgi:hypothetical protein
MRLFNRYTPILLTIGLVLWLESLVTVEWSYPYCLNREDGPAYARMDAAALLDVERRCFSRT